MVAVIIEWVGPRCWSCGIKMSMSGIVDNTRTSGRFRFVLSACDVVDPQMCPNAKCPTANKVFPLAFFDLAVQ